MSWQRMKVAIPDQPLTPAFRWWLLAGVLMLIVSVMLFLLQASGTLGVLSELTIWLLSVVPLSGWLLLFLLRCKVWEVKLDAWDLLQDEVQLVQKQWEAWASRYIAVLGSCILLPDGVTATGIIDASVNALPSRGRLTRRISETVTPIKASLAGVQRAIQALPQEIPLRVIIATDLPDDGLSDEWDHAWKALFPNRAVPDDLTITHFLSVSWIEERLEHSATTVELILLIQKAGEKQYSDGLAALLLTSDELAQRYLLPCSARLLRPMPLNMMTFEEDLALFLQTQTCACATTRVSGDSLDWENVAASLMSVGAAHGTAWQPEERMILETWCGIPGPLSPWLLAALATDLVSLQQNSLLTLFSSGEDCFVSTIVAGNQTDRLSM